MTHEAVAAFSRFEESADARPQVIQFDVGELTASELIKLGEVEGDVAQRLQANYDGIVVAMAVDAVEAVQTAQDVSVQELIAESLLNGVERQMTYQDPDERAAFLVGVLNQLRTIGDERLASKEQQELAAERAKVAALETRLAEVKAGRQAVMQDLLRAFEGDPKRALLLMANLDFARLDSPIDFTQPARGAQAYSEVPESEFVPQIQPQSESLERTSGLTFRERLRSFPAMARKLVSREIQRPDVIEV